LGAFSADQIWKTLLQQRFKAIKRIVFHQLNPIRRLSD